MGDFVGEEQGCAGGDIREGRGVFGWEEISEYCKYRVIEDALKHM